MRGRARSEEAVRAYQQLALPSSELQSICRWVLALHAKARSLLSTQAKAGKAVVVTETEEPRAGAHGEANSQGNDRVCACTIQ